jgi:hypothetical protein
VSQMPKYPPSLSRLVPQGTRQPFRSLGKLRLIKRCHAVQAAKAAWPADHGRSLWNPSSAIWTNSEITQSAQSTCLRLGLGHTLPRCRERAGYQECHCGRTWESSQLCGFPGNIIDGICLRAGISESIVSDAPDAVQYEGRLSRKVLGPDPQSCAIVLHSLISSAASSQSNTARRPARRRPAPRHSSYRETCGGS